MNESFHANGIAGQWFRAAYTTMQIMLATIRQDMNHVVVDVFDCRLHLTPGTGARVYPVSGGVPSPSFSMKYIRVLVRPNHHRSMVAILGSAAMRIGDSRDLEAAVSRTPSLGSVTRFSSRDPALRASNL